MSCKPRSKWADQISVPAVVSTSCTATRNRSVSRCTLPPIRYPELRRRPISLESMFLVGSANEELRAMTDSPSIRDRRLRIISGNPCARYASAASALILSNGKTATVRACAPIAADNMRSEEHTSELQSRSDLVCRLLLEKKKKKQRRAELRRLS